MKVVTSGYRYLDIDAYAGCIAYAELLNVLGESSIAAATAPLNESITATIRDWNAGITTDYQAKADDEFVIIDLSDPAIFDKFVIADRVVEIIDHHLEFVDYWKERLQVTVQIEFIGAACTLVTERWQQAGKLDGISETSARLLMCGILDNTLNFKARVSTSRDQAAYDALKPYANLPDDWPSQYFSECQQSITADLPTAIRNDFKMIGLKSMGGEITAGQLVIWDAQSLLREQLEVLRDCMRSIATEWFMNIVSIAEGKSYFLTSSESVQSGLQDLLHVTFREGMAEADRLWLRKEIIKQDLEAAKS